MIRIADNLALPIDVVTRRLAILGMSGSGKSNVAVVLAEGMFKAGIPWVAIDPKGDWWGVRSSKDGKSSGLPIPIFGGLKGDVPLEPTAGKIIGELIVDQRLTCVLDISEFEDRQKMWGFLVDLGDTLLRRNRQALHLYLEEADEYLPQSTKEKGNLPRCLGVWQRVVKRGRFRGIGTTQITQRNASLNKDTLYMAEALIAMRAGGKGDREAVRGWVEHHNAAAEIVTSLPSLADGEGWVSSPAWLRKTQRLHFHRRQTFDSGATPVLLKGNTPPTTLADVDLAALQERMASTIERAKAEDPRELRRRIAELERELKQRPAAEPKTLKVPVLSQADFNRLGDLAVSIERHGAEALESARQAAEAFKAVADRMRSAPIPNRPILTQPAPKRLARTEKVQRENASPAGLSAPEQRILSTVSMLVARGLPLNRDSVARWMGIHPNGSRYNTSLASLRAQGYMDGFQTHIGNENGTPFDPPYPAGPDGALQALKEEAQRRVFREILEAGKHLSREELAERLGIHPNGSRYNTTLAWLRDMGVIPERGSIYPTEGVYR